MKKQNIKSSIEVIQSTGNVFEDLNLPNPEEYLAKAKLAQQINKIIDSRGLKQTEAAKLLEIDQPKISMIVRGQLSSFSLERLMSYLNKLDQDIQIIVKPKPLKRRDHGHLKVAFG